MDKNYTIEQLKDFYFSNDEPCPYKLKCKSEILIYPVLVKNWNTYERCMNLLTIDRKDYNDIKILKMSDLDFLLDICKSDEENMEKLCYIFKYSLHENLIYIDESNGKKELKILDYENPRIVNGNTVYDVKYKITSRDFKDLRKIFLFQNIYNYVDYNMSADVKEIYKSYLEVQAIKTKDYAIPTLEKKKVFLMSKNGMSMDNINNMSYRIFDQMYNINLNLDMYIAKNIIKASQKYDVKEEIKHPMYQKESTLEDVLFVDSEVITKELGKIQ